MPVHRQPKSLEALGLESMCKQLNLTCRRLQLLSHESSPAQVLFHAERIIRPYYVNALPARIRCQAIEETSRMLYGPSGSSTHISGPAPLYLLALLLGRDVKHLKVNLCCYYGCSHQTSLLKLIAREGVGLESLELARAALLRLDSKLLRTALMSTKNLLSLTLRNIANDSILEIIGKVCPKLVILDVACSRQVTDAGLKKLLLELEFKDKMSPQQQQENQKQQKRNHRHRHRHEQRRITSWTRIKTMLSKLKTKSHKTMGKDVQGLFFEYCESRHSLCDTLRVLNVATTGVTSVGILMALAHVPKLESLAEFNHIGRVVEIIDQAVINVTTPLNLTQARTSRTTSSRLELLARTCPKIDKLRITEPHHCPEELNIFSHLTNLSVHGVPAKKQWFNGFHNYLRANGKNLRELDLRVETTESPVQLDLREILVNCPNLEKLTEEGPSVVWLDGPEPTILRRLKRVQLGRTVNAKAVVKVLSLAPELVSLHLHSCFDLTDHHLEKFFATTKSELSTGHRSGENSHVGFHDNLTCFYVYEASGITAKTVINMFKDWKSLRRIGNLANWGLDCETVEMLRNTVTRANLDVELCPGSHWFWSNCIQ